jgi:hypothetical protein
MKKALAFAVFDALVGTVVLVVALRRDGEAARNLHRLAAAFEADPEKAQAELAGTWQIVEGTVTEAHPPDEEDTFGWLVLDDKVSCLFDEHEPLPAAEGQKVKIRGKVLCREVTGRVKLVACSQVE